MEEDFVKEHLPKISPAEQETVDKTIGEHARKEMKCPNIQFAILFYSVTDEEYASLIALLPWYKSIIYLVI